MSTSNSNNLKRISSLREVPPLRGDLADRMLLGLGFGEYISSFNSANDGIRKILSGSSIRVTLCPASWDEKMRKQIYASLGVGHSLNRRKVIGEAFGRVRQLSNDKLSNEQASRKRFAHSYKPVYQVTDVLGESWGYGISLYLELLTTAVFKELLPILISTIVASDDMVAFMKNLKSLSELAKKQGDFFSGSYKQYVNLELLGGYLPTIVDDTFVDEVRNWVTGDIIHCSFRDGVVSEDIFLDDLEEGMYEFFEDLPMVNEANADFISLEDWLSDLGRWARGGASTEVKRVVYNIENKAGRVRKSKWNAALLTSVSDLHDRLTQPASQRAKVIQKREAAKVRAVISSDDDTYLQMAYISEWLETALRGSTISTLYMTNDQVQAMWVRIAESCNSDTVKLPLDQSHFDWQQNIRMIDRFFGVLKQVVMLRASEEWKTSLLPILEEVRQKLVVRNTSITIKDFKDVFDYEKGVLSGWRWTALMDSVFNLGEFRAATKLCERLGVNVSVVDLVVQGDDDMVEVGSMRDAIAIVEAYRLMNFDINPSKFFIAYDRHEYLRKVVTASNVSGYPARSLLNLLWRNPVSKDPPAGDLRIRDQLNAWNTAFSRGLDESVCKKYMIADMIGGNGLSREQVIKVLTTPAYLGGLGVFSGDGGLALVTDAKKFRARIDISKLKGLIPLVDEVTRLDGPPTERELLDFVSDKLEYTDNVWSGGQTMVEECEPSVAVSLYTVQQLMSWPKERLSPRWKRDKTAAARDILLARFRERRDWDGVDDLMEVGYSIMSKKIHATCGRGVWLDWVAGKLPFGVGVVWGWSSAYVGSLNDETSQRVFSIVLRKHSVNYNFVRRLAALNIAILRDLLPKYGITIGD